MSELLIPQTNTVDRIMAAALNGLAAHTCRVYIRHLKPYCAWLAAGGKLTREATLAYLKAQQLQESSYNQALSAIKRLATEAAENQWIDWPTARTIESIPAKRTKGVRTGVWLVSGEAAKLLAAPDTSTLKGKRDTAVLALLLTCGLRRSEVSSLQVSQVQMRGGRPYIVNLLGKGNRVRTVAIPPVGYEALERWAQASQIVSGPLLRSFTTDGKVSDRPLSTTGVWNVVEAYSDRLGLGIAPHDLRRTFAKLARKNGAPLDVIQRSLGHSSVTTTERYTNSGEEANAGDYLDL